MSLAALVYASTSRLPAKTRGAELARLIDQATANNRRLQMTGALILCGTRFAQILEGPAEALLGLADRINRDPRHTDFTILSRGPIAVRRFDRFGMAYEGHSLFVSRNIALPLAQVTRGSEPAVEPLIQLMIEFLR